jgi:predicted O-linked N-acetylglucosamine transferase (SPINDLY family)
LRPNSSPALLGLGNIYKELGRTDAARSMYERFVTSTPDAGVEVKSALLLPVICKSHEAIQFYRANIFKKIESLKAKHPRVQDPYAQVGTTSFLLAYHGLNNKQLQETIARLYVSLCPELSWTSPHRDKASRRDDKITIGFASRFLRSHTIGYLNYGIIKHLNRKRFRVKLFRFAAKGDHLSAAIQNAADEVVLLPDNLKKARKTIADQNLDILFYPDIGMESLTYFLAFARLAPVQCTTWGHPDSTGIPNMDYYLSSQHAEPPHAKEHYSEQLVILKRFVMYCSFPELPCDNPSRARFGIPEDKNLYICPQSLFKFHPDFDAALRAILQKDPQGVLLLFEGKHKTWTQLLRERFDRTLPDVVDRVWFYPRVPQKEFLAILMQANVILDTFHFAGGYTSLLCFACGLPIVTLPGRFMRGRLTYGFYLQMEIFDCVAKDFQSYVDLALKLAKDHIWNSEIRKKIKARSASLFEDMDAVYELERFFERSVRASEKKRGQLA